MVVEDIDKKSVVSSKKSKKSRKSVGGKKKKKVAEPLSPGADQEIQFNEIDFDGFNEAAAKKKSVRGARSSKAHREQTLEDDAAAGEDFNNELKPDIEAEEISPSRKRANEQSPTVNKVNLFKPIREIERERAEAEEKE